MIEWTGRNYQLRKDKKSHDRMIMAKDKHDLLIVENELFIVSTGIHCYIA